MAKRFTDTEIWSEDWYLDMPSEYKLLWNFVLSKCNHAGIWKPNKFLFTSTCGQVDLKKAVEYFNNGKIRIIVLESGNWFFPGFFSFQYGTNFNENSKVHLSILKIYKSENISLENCYSIDKQTFKDLTSKRPLPEVNDRVKDKDKDKEYLKKGVVGEKNFEPLHGKFIEAWKLWISCRSKKFKNEASEAIGRKKFFELCRGDENLAFPIVEQSIANGWAGLFEVKNNSPGKLEIQVKSKQEQQSDRIKNVAQNLIKSLKDNQNADIRPMEIAQVHS